MLKDFLMHEKEELRLTPSIYRIKIRTKRPHSNVTCKDYKEIYACKLTFTALEAGCTQLAWLVVL